jgi:hypothetical protein
VGLKITQRGDWKATSNWLKKLQRADFLASLEKYGQVGVSALSAATPVESGETAGSWSYEIESRGGYFAIRWTNSHKVGGKPLAIMLQYGHGTRQGGYVQGQDYINPAIRPVFDQIDAELRRVVSE